MLEGFAIFENMSEELNREQTRLEMIEEMLRKNPKDNFLNYAAALEYQKKGDKGKAIGLIEQIIERDKNYLGAYYQLGQMYEELGRIDEAIQLYRDGKVIAKKQNDMKTIGELTEALMLLDEEAKDY